MKFYDTFTNSALVVVDAQKGFTDLCPAELPVPGALGIVKVVNRLLTMPWKRIIATQDWHPSDHCSFKAQGGPYPPHCVQRTDGAEFLPDLWTCYFHMVMRKGFRKDQDAYSPDLDHRGVLNGLVGHFETVYLTGICTNICVFETACDFKVARHEKVVIIEDACAALDLPEDSPYHAPAVRAKALEIGIKFIKAAEILPIM